MLDIITNIAAYAGLASFCLTCAAGFVAIAADCLGC